MNYSSGGYYQPPKNGNGYENNNVYGNNNVYHTSSGFRPFQRMSHFVPYEVWMREKNYIKKLSTLAACAVIAFIVLSGVFVGVFQGIFMAISMLDGFDNVTFSEKWESAEFMYLFETIYSVLIVGGPFFLLGLYFSKKGMLTSIPAGKPKNAKYLPLIVLGGFGFCLAGNIITSYFDAIIEAVSGFGLEMPEMPSTPKSVIGVLLFYLSTAVAPALVEEMALRGIIMQPLRRYGDWFAIICTSLIFGLMHCNLLQIPFAFIAGIALGYAVVVTESVWTGVLIHFLNNAFAVTVSIINDFYGMDSVQYIVSDVVFYALVVIGLVCAFVYVKKLDKTQFRKSPLVNSGKHFVGFTPPFSAKISNGTLYKTYFVTAPMIIAFIAVAYETVMTLILL